MCVRRGGGCALEARGVALHAGRHDAGVAFSMRCLGLQQRPGRHQGRRSLWLDKKLSDKIGSACTFSVLCRERDSIEIPPISATER